MSLFEPLKIIIITLITGFCICFIGFPIINLVFTTISDVAYTTNTTVGDQVSNVLFNNLNAFRFFGGICIVGCILALIAWMVGDDTQGSDYGGNPNTRM